MHEESDTEICCCSKKIFSVQRVLKNNGEAHSEGWKCIGISELLNS